MATPRPAKPCRPTRERHGWRWHGPDRDTGAAEHAQSRRCLLVGHADGSGGRSRTPASRAVAGAAEHGAASRRACTLRSHSAVQVGRAEGVAAAATALIRLLELLGGRAIGPRNALDVVVQRASLSLTNEQEDDVWALYNSILYGFTPGSPEHWRVPVPVWGATFRALVLQSTARQLAEPVMMSWGDGATLSSASASEQGAVTGATEHGAPSGVVHEEKSSVRVDELNETTTVLKSTLLPRCELEAMQRELRQALSVSGASAGGHKHIAQATDALLAPHGQLHGGGRGFGHLQRGGQASGRAAGAVAVLAGRWHLLCSYDEGGEAWRQREALRARRVESSGCLGLALQSTPASQQSCFACEAHLCRRDGGAAEHAVENVVQSLA